MQSIDLAVKLFQIYNRILVSYNEDVSKGEKPVIAPQLTATAVITATAPNNNKTAQLASDGNSSIGIDDDDEEGSEVFQGDIFTNNDKLQS